MFGELCRRSGSIQYRTIILLFSYPLFNCTSDFPRTSRVLLQVQLSGAQYSKYTWDLSLTHLLYMFIMLSAELPLRTPELCWVVALTYLDRIYDERESGGKQYCMSSCLHVCCWGYRGPFNSSINNFWLTLEYLLFS